MNRRRAIEGLAAAAIIGRRALAQDVREGRPPEAAKGSAGRAGRDAPPWKTLPPTPRLPMSATESKGHSVEINGTEIWYAQFGDTAAPPVLLLHGGMGSSDYWGHQVEHLARSTRVTVMDTRGHGRSPVTDGRFGYGLFAQDALALLDRLNIAQAAVIGWSDGAVTGLQFAMKHPERVSRLFAFAANSALDGTIPNGASAPTFKAYGRRCRSEYSKLSPHPKRWPQLMEGLRAMWRREPNFSAAELASIHVPTAICDGEHDEIIKRSDTDRMATTVPGARKIILPRVSHFAMLQDSKLFNGALDDFLK